MAEYRRLISYIYEYEGTEKGRNVGFAKLEARNGLCRIHVNVKKIFMSGNETGVYLMAPKTEIFLGKLFVGRTNSAEFHTTVSVGDVEESGISMEDCYGLTIREKDDGWRRYATVWEDSDTQEDGETRTRETSTRGMPEQGNQELVENLAINGVRKTEMLTAQELSLAIGEPEPEPVQPAEEPPRQPEPAPQVEEPPRQPKPVHQPKEPLRQPEPVQPAEEPPRQPEPAPPVEEPSRQPVNGAASAAPQDAFLIGDPAVLKKLEEEELKESRVPVWDYLVQHYAKIQAFDSALPNEALIIRPQDIGLLPRELWSYGNNSFLLHGYYNYRYLLLARLVSQKGKIQYVLGVPGNYYSSEKYMAAMFGFPRFVLSRRQTTTDGRFGYWYTPIRLDTGHEVRAVS